LDEIWNQNEIIIDNVYVLAVATEINKNIIDDVFILADDIEPCFADEC